MEVAAKLAERPGRGTEGAEGEPAERQPPRDARNDQAEGIGIDVRDLDREIGRRLGLTTNALGVLVVHVEPLSPAYDADIRRGTVILEINRREVRSAAEYHRITNAAKPGSVLTFLVHVNGGQRALRTVRVEASAAPLGTWSR
jgi:serine protease Do